MAENNHDAFTEIYNRYWKKLFTVAANKVFELEEAREIVQNVFISLWDRRNVLQIEGSLSAYLAMSVKYRVINALDARFTRKKYLDSLVKDKDFDDSTREWLEFMDLESRLSVLIAALPEKCRLVFELSRQKGYSNKEIAAELNISEKTVEAHLSKARKDLRNRMHTLMSALL